MTVKNNLSSPKLMRVLLTYILIFITCLIGATGYHIYIGNILPKNSHNLKDKLNSTNYNCSENLFNKTGVKNGYCLTNSPQHFDTLLLGDSNADHLFWGFTSKSNLKLISLGQGGCAPFFGLSTYFYMEGEQNCHETITPALNFALQNPSIKTIIISMAGQGFINSKRNLYGDEMKIHSSKNDIKIDNNLLFTNSMRFTLKKLLDSKKEIIYILPIPRLDFHPRDCAKIRSFKVSNNKNNPLCATSRNLFDNDTEPYLNLVLRVLKELPLISIFNPANELCDEEYCYALKNGILLYRDELHLSDAGSEYIVEKIVN